MSKINGFKFEYGNLMSERKKLLVILEISGSNSVLQCISGGYDVYCVDITDKEDEICKRLEAMKIDTWNNKNYDGPMEFFPGFQWKLSISIDRINIDCNGSNNCPDNWNEFIDVLKYIGIKNFE